MFVEHFKQLFYSANADLEASPPTPLPDYSPITAAELQGVLGDKFRGNVSSGMCPLPSQLVKHLHSACLQPLAAYLNLCVGGTTPPQTWRTLKLVPLFKGRGDRTNPADYRALAVGHPLAKLVMGVVNLRLEKVAAAKELRAPT